MEEKILNIIREFFKKQPVYHNYDNDEKCLKRKNWRKLWSQS